jgi:hypothetical protein
VSVETVGLRADSNVGPRRQRRDSQGTGSSSSLFGVSDGLFYSLLLLLLLPIWSVSSGIVFAVVISMDIVVGAI